MMTLVTLWYKIHFRLSQRLNQKTIIYYQHSFLSKIAKGYIFQRINLSVNIFKDQHKYAGGRISAEFLIHKY